jgi:peptide/nickel transport system substrate-binding protein
MVIDDNAFNRGAILTMNLSTKILSGTMLAGVSLAVILTGALTAAEAATPKDTVVMAKQIDDIISLDPAESFEFSGSEAVGNIYDRLLSYDFKDVSIIKGQVAESWAVAEDGLTYTFKIRKGMKFHSGNPVTAADAAYSLHRAVALNKSPAFILTQFGFTKDNMADRIRAPDAETLLIRVEKPVAPSFFYYCLTATVSSVVDSKLVQTKDVNGDFGNEFLKTNSAASGAYVLRSWKAKESYTLDANDSYWAGKPKNKRVVVRHIAEAATQRLMLEKGDVDYARNLEKDQINGLASNKSVVMDTGVKGSLMYLGLNQKNPILAKPDVRQALKMLVDYKSIEENILKGTRTTHQAFLPKGFLGALNETPFSFDLAKAKELLAKAGHPDGFSITMDVRNVSPYADVAQAVQASWAKAGVKLELIPGDGKQTLTKYRARNHDIYIGDWGPDYQDPHTNAETFAINLDNSDTTKSKTLAWRNTWDIADMSKRTLAAVEERDSTKRAATYLALQKEHQASSPFVVMFQQIEVAAHPATVKGFVIGPSFDVNLYAQITK